MIRARPRCGPESVSRPCLSPPERLCRRPAGQGHPPCAGEGGNVRNVTAVRCVRCASGQISFHGRFARTGRILGHWLRFGCLALWGSVIEHSPGMAADRLTLPHYCATIRRPVKLVISTGCIAGCLVLSLGLICVVQMDSEPARSSEGALVASGWASPVKAASAVATSGRPARTYVAIALPPRPWSACPA